MAKRIAIAFITILISGGCFSSTIKIKNTQDSSIEAQNDYQENSYNQKHTKSNITSSNIRPPKTVKKSANQTIGVIDKEIEERMRLGETYRDNCPVKLKDLRYLRVKYFGFDKRVHTGEMIVHKSVAKEVISIFDTLSNLKYPIRKVKLASDYGGDDDKSMEADNTSAFNCRLMTGGKKWSKHSFGKAIDINPLENPYVKGYKVLPPQAKKFAFDRENLNLKYKSVIIKNSPVVKVFYRYGWRWGGNWRSLKDYQHFEK